MLPADQLRYDRSPTPGWREPPRRRSHKQSVATVRKPGESRVHSRIRVRAQVKVAVDNLLLARHRINANQVLNRERIARRRSNPRYTDSRRGERPNKSLTPILWEPSPQRLPEACGCCCLSGWRVRWSDRNARLARHLSNVGYFALPAIVGSQHVPYGSHAKKCPWPFISARPGMGSFKTCLFIVVAIASALAANRWATHAYPFCRCGCVGCCDRLRNALPVPIAARLPSIFAWTATSATSVTEGSGCGVIDTASR